MPRAFLAAAREDPAWTRLDALLVRLARFYGVSPDGAPRPRLLLVPVPDGFGTHAYALRRTLLLEIREGDRLADQAAVVVHENAHFLFSRLPRERQDKLEAAAREAGAAGAAAWATLHEALPTALGQGVADRAFRKGWSTDGHWYHTAEVDRYAKALLPLLDRTLDAGGVLDEAFVTEGRGASFPDHLDQHALLAASVELAVEDLLPGAEVELPVGDRHDHLAAHDLPLEVGVGVVLAGAVVPVALARLERGELLEPAPCSPRAAPARRR